MAILHSQNKMKAFEITIQRKKDEEHNTSASSNDD